MVDLGSGSRHEEVKQVKGRVTADDKKALKKRDALGFW